MSDGQLVTIDVSAVDIHWSRPLWNLTTMVLGVSVSGVINKVSELVQVVAYCPLPLEVGHGL